MNGRQGHALVIGASMAGLLAARVLSDHYATVTLLDRDSFPEQPGHRAGVPQSHHAHALLPRGQQVIEQLFPGMMDQLRADGALSRSGGTPFAIVSPAGKLPLPPNEGEFLAFSRYLLEYWVRQRLGQRDGVNITARHEVSGLLADQRSERVLGVRARLRDGGGERELWADLVVDAGGRASRAPDWLAQLGYAAPSEETINSGLGYASRMYARPAAFPEEWQALIVNGRPPLLPRAGLILPIENGHWHVSLAGIAGHAPPTDEHGFLEWARSLADPSLYEAIRIAEPLTPIRGYATPVNRLRRYELLARRPQGFIVTGDAVAAFNPIYGQGMTVSALEALALDACLREQRDRPRPGFEQRVQQAFADAAAPAWLVSTAEDLRWPGVALTGGRRRGTRLLHGWMNLLLRQAVHDPALAGLYMNVISMLEPARALAAPGVIGSVVAGNLGRRIRGAAGERSLALTPAALEALRARPATFER